MRVRLLAWLFVAMCSAATAAAQVTTGSIVGTVTDTQGQVVPGATVAIREVGKQTVTSVVSDENGNYVAPFLNPGTYEVSVELSGFALMGGNSGPDDKVLPLPNSPIVRVRAFSLMGGVVVERKPSRTRSRR